MARRLGLGSPLRYPGGKSGLAGWIIDHFPNHDKYIEVFGGGASVLYAKPPSRAEVLNDQFGHLANFWRVLRDDRAALQDRLTLTPYSRDEYERAWRNLLSAEPIGTPVERAADIFTMMRQSYAGRLGGGWGYAKRQHPPHNVSKVVDQLDLYAGRLRGVAIDNRDFAQILKSYDHPDNLFYCDPPYQTGTRNQAGDHCSCTADQVCYRCRLYGHEMADDDHRRFLDAVTKSAGMVVVSHPDTPLYRERLAGWTRDSREVAYGMSNPINGKRVRAIEYLWLNPRAKAELDKLPFMSIAKAIETKPLPEIKEMTNKTDNVIELLTARETELQSELTRVRAALAALVVKAEPIVETPAVEPLPTTKPVAKAPPATNAEMQRIYEAIPTGMVTALDYRSICKGLGLDWRRVKLDVFLNRHQDVRRLATDKKRLFLPTKSPVAVDAI